MNNPSVVIGDPLIPVGEQYMVIVGYGDFRSSKEMAMTMIAFAVEAKKSKEDTEAPVIQEKL